MGVVTTTVGIEGRKGEAWRAKEGRLVYIMQNSPSEDTLGLRNWVSAQEHFAEHFSSPRDQGSIPSAAASPNRKGVAPD